MKTKKLLIASTMIAAAGTAAAQDYIEAQSFNDINTTDARPLNYRPTAEGGFACTNGKNLYTRALYGGNTLFRVETSDVPIFAAYHKRDNRNINFEVNGVRLDSAAMCNSLYNSGMRIYTLSDPRWGEGTVELKVLATYDHEGAVWEVKVHGFKNGAKLTGHCDPTVKVKLNRSGDIGADPYNCFAPAPGESSTTVTVDVADGEPVYMAYAERELTSDREGATKALWDAAKATRDAMAGRLVIETPDPWLNHLGGTLTTAGDGIWDGKTWQHGAVGWRMPLSGWRGAYTGDFLGWHDRARTHFDAYAKSQVTAVEPTIPHPSQDTSMCMARADKRWGTQMYSNGYICRNPERNDQMHHYDMNLCYIDELMWHLKWTGDLEYARKMWPVITAHLAWEKRNYDPDGDGLYDAYCCIWASDALYYNSGAVTHSSAYNYRANKIAAEVAELIGEDSEPYRKEAELILDAMNRTLWMKGRGVWAEHKDFMGHKRLHDHPAVWTVYHAIDSDVATPQMAYSATRYVDNYIPRIPVRSTADIGNDFYTISTTDWLPYAWSINNVAHAEVYHTALAYWLAGRNDEATHLLKSAIIDGMNLGRSPGNIGQISHYDAARGECYRDFGDPIGVMSRAVVQGLFGFTPDATARRVMVKPGFPSDWNHARIKHPDFELSFVRDGNEDRYTLEGCKVPADSITFRIATAYTTVESVDANGKAARWENTADATGRPTIDVTVPAGETVTVTVRSTGEKAENSRARALGETRDNYALVEQGNQRWWREEKALARPDTTAVLGLEMIAGRSEPIDLGKVFNASVTDIFNNKYLSPRSPYTTLQIPVQGIGEWCHPRDMAEIADSALRADGGAMIAGGPRFVSPREGKNIVYTSLFDNYPESVEIGLKGKAKGLALMIAGSTNHMQCHMENAVVTVTYSDGSTERMPLTAPLNYCPIEQDYFIDGKAFKVDTERPMRYALKSGIASRNLGDELKIEGVYGRRIDGGAAVVLCVPLDPKKKLRSMKLTTLSNDVVVGLLAATYIR